MPSTMVISFDLVCDPHHCLCCYYNNVVAHIANSKGCAEIFFQRQAFPVNHAVSNHLAQKDFGPRRPGASRPNMRCASALREPKIELRDTMPWRSSNKEIGRASCRERV